MYLQEVGSIIGKKGEIVKKFREEVSGFFKSFYGKFDMGHVREVAVTTSVECPTRRRDGMVAASPSS